MSEDYIDVLSVAMKMIKENNFEPPSAIMLFGNSEGEVREYIKKLKDKGDEEVGSI